MEKFIEHLMNIEIFKYEETLIVESDDGEFTYTEVEWLIPSLEKYNERCISLTTNWDIIIWTDEGEIIEQFNIIDVDDFKKILSEKLG